MIQAAQSRFLERIFTEKEAHQHLKSQCEAESEMWMLSTSHFAKRAKTLLYNVLLLRDRNWLKPVEDGDFFRSKCIP